MPQMGPLWWLPMLIIIIFIIQVLLSTLCFTPLKPNKSLNFKGVTAISVFMWTW